MRRDGSTPRRSARSSRAATTAQRWSSCKLATSTPGRSTRSKSRSRWRTSSAHGCTSMARSGSSPVPTPGYRHLLHGYEAADSWATDAHKTLNVPYDCGLAIVRDPTALRAAMSMHGDYLIHDAAGDPFEKVPELSRRARAFTVWAVLRSLGRSGVTELVEQMAGHARAFADGIAGIEGAEVLNEVVFTQVCVDLRGRRPHSRRRPPDAGGRHRMDQRLGLASAGRSAHLGEQLVDHRRRRRAHVGRPAHRRGGVVMDSAHPTDSPSTERTQITPARRSPLVGLTCRQAAELRQA